MRSGRRAGRGSSAASCGESIAPSVMYGPGTPSRISALLPHRAPATTSLWLLRYFVAEWQRGRCPGRWAAGAGVWRSCCPPGAQAMAARQLRHGGQILLLEGHRIGAFQHDQTRSRRQRRLHLWPPTWHPRSLGHTELPSSSAQQRVQEYGFARTRRGRRPPRRQSPRQRWRRPPAEQQRILGASRAASFFAQDLHRGGLLPRV